MLRKRPRQISRGLGLGAKDFHKNFFVKWLKNTRQRIVAGCWKTNARIVPEVAQWLGW